MSVCRFFELGLSDIHHYFESKTDSVWDIARRRMQERRKKRRFPFKQQVIFKLHKDDIWSEFQGVTENVSELGVLMMVDSSAPVMVDAEVRVAIRDDNLPTLLSCLGKVVRVEPALETGKVAVAVRCNHPLTISKVDVPAAQR